MNNVNIVGRITKDIELQVTNNGKQVVKFTVAVNRRTKDKQADFISCIAWEKTASIIESYFFKGSLIGINGSIQTGSYEINGRKVYTTDVLVKEIDFLEKREQTIDDTPVEPVYESGIDLNSDDLPF